METVTISSKFQVVIPREVREKFNLKPGQKLMFIPYKGTLRVVIIPSIEAGRGLLAGLNTDGVREEEDEERGMNVVDSSGWLEYFSDGANAGFFAQPIQDANELLTPTICFYEVFKRVHAQFGEERALEAVGSMSLGKIADLSRQIVVDAALLSAELKLAMADSIILATARAHDATLWTQDAHFKDIEGVQYIEKKI